MTKQFFAIGNHYASETSKGFLNTEFVRIFDTAAERDAWLAENPKAVRACTKREAIDAVIGNDTSVGDKPMTRAKAWEWIVEYDADCRMYDEVG